MAEIMIAYLISFRDAIISLIIVLSVEPSDSMDGGRTVKLTV